MIKKNLIFKNYIEKKKLNINLLNKFSLKFLKVKKEIEIEINDSQKTLNILNKNFKFNFNLNQLKTFKKYKTLAIIGMGGSILGIEAIKNFFLKKVKKKIYFFNNLNSQDILNFKEKEKFQKVLFIVISKSGNTIETLTNFFLLNVLKKKLRNIIIITEKKNNTLFELVKKNELFHIEHKNSIGGRYSVLSEVGIVPSYLMGLNINKLRSRIREPLKKKNIQFLKESSIKLACLMHSKKFNNLIFLNYAPELDKFLFWCQQLIAESLGKEGKGFFPVISPAPKDHHSLLQLYLDGPQDKLFYIFSIDNDSKKKINLKKTIFNKNYLNKKKLSTIKDAQKNALMLSLKKNKIPFREFKINTANEEVLGELFSYFILETIFVGKIAGVNPFDQPAVEQVKIGTKKILM